MTTPRFAYLHFGGPSTIDGDDGPRLTLAAPLKYTTVPWSGRTVSGYGSKIPTAAMVFWNNRWRRVYVAQYGNSGTAYIGKPGAWLATVGTDGMSYTGLFSLNALSHELNLTPAQTCDLYAAAQKAFA